MNTQINLSRQFLLLTSHSCCVPSPTTRAATHGFLFVFLLLVATVAAQPNGNQRNNNLYGANPNFKPSMAVTIVVLAAAFVFIALFSLYIRRCARDSSVGGAIGGTLRARSRRVARGLDPSVIETFPTFAYSAVKGLKIGKGALECAVCLNEFEDDETLRLLPKCDHVFHPECIDAWLASHSTCPVCRANLIPGSDADDTSAQQFTMATEDSGDVQDVDTALPTESQEHVLIGANEEHSTDSPSQVIDIGEIPVQNRPVRSKSTRPRRFPRSHSTGHSLVQPGENVDRFTLRLPDDVRRQIMNGKMTRSTSCVTFATRQGSVSGSRRGNRFGFGFGGAEGINRGGKSVRFDRGTSTRLDRWSLPFFWRNPSVRASKRGEGSVKKGGEGSVKSPFDCLGTNKAGDSELTRPPV